MPAPLPGQSYRTPQPGSEGPVPSWWETAGAAVELGQDRSGWNRVQAQADAYDPVYDALDDAAQARVVAAMRKRTRFSRGQLDVGENRRELIWSEVRRAKAAGGFKVLPDDREEFDRSIKQPLIAARRTNESIVGRGSVVPAFAGGMVGAMSDPVNVISSFIGGPAGGVGRQMLVSALSNMGAEVATIPGANRELAYLNDQETTGEQVQNVLFAGAGGAALTGAAKAIKPIAGAVKSGQEAALARIIPLLPEKLRPSIKTMADVPDEALADAVEAAIGKDNISPDIRDALHAVRQQAEIDRSNPWINDAAGQARHASELQAAMDRILSSAPRAAAPVPFVDPARSGRRGVPQAGTALSSGRVGVPVGRYDPEQVKALIRGPESAGNDRATNGMGSSASGRYQFIESTFKTLYSQVYGGGAAKANAAWANNRFDVDVQERLMDQLLADNAAILGRAGLPVDNGNLYVMHVLGSGNGPRLLGAAGDTPVASLLSAAIVRQNPTYFGGGRTVAQALGEIRRRVGGGRAGQNNALSSAPDGGDAIDLELMRAQDDLDAANAALSAPRGPLIGEDVAAPLRDFGGDDAAPVLPELPSQPRIDVDKLMTVNRPRLVEYIADPKAGSLKPSVVASQLGIDEGSATALLKSMVEARHIRVSKKKGHYARIPRDDGPQDVLTFIARNGGLRDDEGHGLGLAGVSKADRAEMVPAAVRAAERKRQSGRRDLQRFIPRAGPLLRTSGQSIDRVGEDLWQAGFFGPPSTSPRPSVDEVLELIERAVSGDQKIYAGSDLPALRADDVDQQAILDERLWHDEEYRYWVEKHLNTVAGQYGIELDPPLIQRAMAHYIERGEQDMDAALISAINAESEAARAAAWYEYGDEIGGEVEDQFIAALRADGLDASQALDGPAPVTRDASSQRAGGEADGIPRGPIDPEALAPFDAPDGPGVVAQADSLAHDFQLDAFGGPTAQDVKASLEAKAEGRLKGKAGQKAPGSDGGLFDGGGRQADLEDMSFQFDEDGPARSIADIAADFEQDASIIKSIRDCL